MFSQALLAEKKEIKARKKRTLEALDYLTKSPEHQGEDSSEDTSEAEENVTAAILASLPLKEKTDKDDKKVKDGEKKGPQTRARRK